MAIISSRRLNKIYRSYNSSGWLKYLCIPLLSAAPTCVLAFAKFNDSSVTFFQEHYIITFLLAFWPSIAMAGSKFASDKLRPNASVGDTTLMTLFECIDDVVGAKGERFATQAHAMRVGNDSAQINLFQEITQPDGQIHNLAHCLYHFFDVVKVDKNITFKVALAKMGPIHIEKFECFNPNDKRPRGQIEAYQKDNCGFSRAKALKRLIIVENIQKEIRKTVSQQNYCVSEECEDEEGSIIIYPINHSKLNEIPYCLSVMCSEPGYFKKGQKDLYNFLLDKIEKRICLEYSLKVMKELTNGYRDGAH